MICIELDSPDFASVPSRGAVSDPFCRLLALAATLRTAAIPLSDAVVEAVDAVKACSFRLPQTQENRSDLAPILLAGLCISSWFPAKPTRSRGISQCRVSAGDQIGQHQSSAPKWWRTLPVRIAFDLREGPSLARFSVPGSSPFTASRTPPAE
jgi:hypothetical protein